MPQNNVPVDVRIAALEARWREAMQALAPFAKLQVPKKTNGNAGAYSLYFADIERAKELFLRPDYLAQSAEPMSNAERASWFSARIDEARAQGCTVCRVSVHPEHPTLSLCEGWIDPQADQGEPHWQIPSDLPRGRLVPPHGSGPALVPPRPGNMRE